jgi:hypothetical protein
LLGGADDASSVGSGSTKFTHKSSLSGSSGPKTTVIKRRNSLDKNTKMIGLVTSADDTGSGTGRASKENSKSRTSSAVTFDRTAPVGTPLSGRSVETKVPLLNLPNLESATTANTLANAGSISARNTKRKPMLTTEQQKEIEKRDELLKEAAPIFQKQPVSALWQFYKKPKRPALSSTIGKSMGVPNLGPYGVMPIRTHIRPYSDSMDHSLYLRVVGSDDPEGTPAVPILRLINRGQQERDRITASRDNDRYRTVSAQEP